MPFKYVDWIFLLFQETFIELQIIWWLLLHICWSFFAFLLYLSVKSFKNFFFLFFLVFKIFFLLCYFLYGIIICSCVCLNSWHALLLFLIFLLSALFCPTISFLRLKKLWFMLLFYGFYNCLKFFCCFKSYKYICICACIWEYLYCLLQYCSALTSLSAYNNFIGKWITIFFLVF